MLPLGRRTVILNAATLLTLGPMSTRNQPTRILSLFVHHPFGYQRKTKHERIQFQTHSIPPFPDFPFTFLFFFLYRFALGQRYRGGSRTPIFLGSFSLLLRANKSPSCFVLCVWSCATTTRTSAHYPDSSVTATTLLYKLGLRV
jgi:hypothetical protein